MFNRERVENEYGTIIVLAPIYRFRYRVRLISRNSNSTELDIAYFLVQQLTLNARMQPARFASEVVSEEDFPLFGDLPSTSMRQVGLLVG